MKFAQRNDTTMSDGYVRTTTEGGIATVTFHHPKSNSLPAAILGEMAKQN